MTVQIGDTDKITIITDISMADSELIDTERVLINFLKLVCRTKNWIYKLRWFPWTSWHGSLV